MSNTTEDRITMDMDVPRMILALSEGNPGSATVLIAWLKSSPMAILEMLSLDSKRLYGHHIWCVYKDVCGEDIERFKYHVQVELPNQETGHLSTTGPLSPEFDDKEFWAKRKSGKPGSYWALDVPPTTREYDYPIK